MSYGMTLANLTQRGIGLSIGKEERIQRVKNERAQQVDITSPKVSLYTQH